MSELSKNENKIKELTELNIEFENYFQSTIIAQLFIDANLILRKYSPMVVKQFNLDKSDIGKSLKELEKNFKYASISQDIEDTIKAITVLEKEIQTSDGKWYRMNIVPYIEQKDNKTNGVIITFVDINNYVIALKELNRLNLEHETFIYSISHDLKGPLNNIGELIKTLKNTDTLENQTERNQIIEMIDSSINKTKDMITELTQISREQDGGIDSKEKLEFGDILKEVLLTLKDKIDESQAIIETNFEINEMIVSRKDLRSILYNLISNAIKYRAVDRKPVVLLKTMKLEGHIVLSVKDNGRGIEQDKKDTIFSKFTRVLTNVEGTGVGLFLVKRIVDNLGGKIQVESAVNEGSEFKVYFKG